MSRTPAALLFALSLAACSGKDDPPVIVDDSGPDIIRESEVIDDSGDSGDSAADDTADTGDTGAPAVEIVGLRVAPVALRLDVGASVLLRAVLVDAQGKRYEAEPAWEVEDAAVAEVDAQGVLTALAAGEVLIRAEAEGHVAALTLRVQDVPELYVRVVDSLTGVPIEGARITWQGRRAVTDAAGDAQLGVTGAAPITFSAFLPDGDYIPATLVDVLAREVIVPLRPSSEEEGAPVALSGEVDYAGVVEAEWDEQVVGLVGPSLQRSPLLFDPGQLLAADRGVEVFGLPLDLPGNLFVQDHVDDWQAVSWEGELALWSLAGPIPVSELSAGFEAPEQALTALLEHIDDLRYDSLTGVEAVSEGVSGLQVAPSRALDATLDVLVPALPEGAFGNERPLLIALQDNGAAGQLLVGLGQSGPGDGALRYTDDGDGSLRVLAYYEQGGVGSEQGHAASMGEVVNGVAEPLAWMRPPSLDSLDGEARTFAVTSDPRASVVRVYVEAPAAGGHRDLWLPGGVIEGSVPDNAPDVGLGRPSVEILAVETWEGTWESLLSDGGLSEQALIDGARTTAGIHVTVRGD